MTEDFDREMRLILRPLTFSERIAYAKRELGVELRNPEFWVAIALLFAVYVMVILLIVIFIGFMNHFRAMYYQSTQNEVSKGDRLSSWCAAPMWLSLIPLLVLGLWWPTYVWDYLTSIAQSLNLGAQ